MHTVCGRCCTFEGCCNIRFTFIGFSYIYSKRNAQDTRNIQPTHDDARIKLKFGDISILSLLSRDPSVQWCATHERDSSITTAPRRISGGRYTRQSYGTMGRLSRLRVFTIPTSYIKHNYVAVVTLGVHHLSSLVHELRVLFVTYNINSLSIPRTMCAYVWSCATVSAALSSYIIRALAMKVNWRVCYRHIFVWCITNHTKIAAYSPG